MHHAYLEFCAVHTAAAYGSPSPTNHQDMIYKRFLGSGIPYICLVLFYGISDSPHGLEPLSSCYLTQKSSTFT